MIRGPFTMHAKLRVALSITLAGLCLLAGCGNSETTATVDGASRTVTDVEGRSVEVPAEPKRIVVLSEPTLDGVLALGVTPIGAVTGRGQSTLPHYINDLAGEIPLLGGIAAPNFELIGKADPDLILVDGTSINNNAEQLKLLAAIAPTVNVGLAGGDWRDTFTRVADALNRVDQGAEVIAAYDQQVADAAASLKGYDEQTFSVVRWQGGSAAMILNELPAGQALTDLGLRRPAAQDRRGRGHSEPVPLERLAEIDGDWMFFGTLGGSSVGNQNAGGTADTSGAEKAYREAVEVPGFEKLSAYRSGQVVLVDGSLWTSTGGPVLMQRLVADIVKALG
ncbi:ABC transporter substrate-binding protein [Nocardioides sp. Bht2]|uniref:ABC transporter substrate-binding protein n=1 Tax=Nocardioides sp. Bht2 TaxID=3392297 RepID=UPI0039B4205D